VPLAVAVCFGTGWIVRRLRPGRSEAFIKTFPAGAFGICLFDLVAWLWLERIGLTLTVVLGYAVAVAYLTVVGWLRYAGSLSPSGGAGTSNALTMPERSAK
jgi:hypothetical protein